MWCRAASSGSPGNKPHRVVFLSLVFQRAPQVQLNECSPEHIIWPSVSFGVGGGRTVALQQSQFVADEGLDSAGR